jgi:predicted amidohydrolase
MRPVTIAMSQFESQVLDVEANLERARQIIQTAAAGGADLVIFPELFTIGYNMSIVGRHLPSLAEHSDGPTVSFLGECARKNSVNVVAPFAMRSAVPGVIENSAAVIDRFGECVGTYSKTHLWSTEREFFRAGTTYPTFKLDFGDIGVMICYDAGFPEVSRQLAFRGAELLVAPAAFAMRDKYMWDIYFRTRALENTCFVAGVNRVGHEGDLHMFGNNQLISPNSSVVAQGPVDADDVQIATIDLSEVAQARDSVPYLRDVKHYEY